MAATYAGYAADPAKQRAWSAANPGNRALRAELADAVWPLVPTRGVLLDVGCGTGWWPAELAARGVASSRLAGIELLDARAAAARGRVPGAAITVGDARELPFPEGGVALVTLFTVLSSLASDGDRRTALAEALRVLAPGGAVVVWEPRLPTGNPRTHRVSRRLLREALGPDTSFGSITLLPPLARRVSVPAYTRLARIPLLRGHRLTVARR